MNKRYFHAMIFALALLIAPFASADVTNVSGDYAMASTDHQVMSDAKACMACHVAPEQKRQETSEYKMKLSHVMGGGSSNTPAFTVPNAKRYSPYFEVGW